MTPHFQIPGWAEQCEQLLLAGEYSRGLEILDALGEIEDLVEKRIMLHLRAQFQIYLGDLEGAKSHLLQAERFFGEHIGVVRDLACVYHQTGELNQWRMAVDRLAERMARVGHRLSPKTWAETRIIIGKFLEEMGRVRDAVVEYTAVLERLETSPSDGLYRSALIQCLRVEALYENGPQLGELYHQVLAIAADDLSFDLWLEREHSLMLAEIELIGVKHAWARADRLLKNRELCGADRRLVIADFVSETALRRQTRPDASEQYLEDLNEGDAYERTLVTILSPQMPEGELLLRLGDLAAEVPWASYLRLLTVIHQTMPDRAIRAEVERKIRLMLTSLPAESRYYWLSRLKIQISEAVPQLSFNPKTRCLTFEDRSVDLSKRRSFCAVLENLMAQPQIDVDELIRRLWNSSFSPEHLHRLRMTVHRLNQELFELCAIPRVIEMTADRVALRSSVKLAAVG